MVCSGEAPRSRPCRNRLIDRCPAEHVDCIWWNFDLTMQLAAFCRIGGRVGIKPVVSERIYGRRILSMKSTRAGARVAHRRVETAKPGGGEGRFCDGPCTLLGHGEVNDLSPLVG